MNNDTQIRRAGTTYWRRHAPKPVLRQRPTQRERPALFMTGTNLSPMLHKRKHWLFREVTLLDALVLAVCVVAGVALAFGWPR